LYLPRNMLLVAAATWCNRMLMHHHTWWKCYDRWILRCTVKTMPLGEELSLILIASHMPKSLWNIWLRLMTFFWFPECWYHFVRSQSRFESCLIFRS
jgi:hypothetical protein